MFNRIFLVYLANIFLQPFSMKKNITLLFLCLFANILLLNAQDVESPEFKNKIEYYYQPLGASNGNIYYYDIIRIKDGIKIHVFKYKESTLELLEEKDVYEKNIKPYVVNHKSKIFGYYKNNKYYFFYSVVHADEYNISMVTFDENFTNPKETELDVIAETSSSLLGGFSVSLSPDCKSAIVALKNYNERKAEYIGITEKTELIYVNLINQTIVYKKFLPIEINGYHLKTKDLKTDNEGNIALIATICDKLRLSADHKRIEVPIKGEGFGFLSKEDKDLKIKEFNLGNSLTISSFFKQTKNGDLIYLADLSDNILMKVLSTDKTKKLLEVSINKNDFVKTGSAGESLFAITESENGYFLNLETGGWKHYVAFISKSGELKWNKELPMATSIYYNANGDNGTTSVCYNNKLIFFTTEHKPYELTDRIQKKLIDIGARNAEYNNKNTNAIVFTLDESGHVDKRIIYDNEIYGSSNGNFGATTGNVNLFDDSNIFIMPILSPKLFRLNKIIIK